jgi:hypothetical protein
MFYRTRPVFVTLPIQQSSLRETAKLHFHGGAKRCPDCLEGIREVLPPALSSQIAKSALPRSGLPHSAPPWQSTISELVRLGQGLNYPSSTRPAPLASRPPFSVAC